MTNVPPPAGDPPPVVPPPAGDPPPAAQLTPEQLQAKLDDANKALKAANKESADRRKRLEELEKAETDRQAASLSETEKLQKQVADAEARAKTAQAQANERLIRAEIVAKAATLKFADPADAFALIDRSKITVSDSGEVEGADELLKELAKAKPYMLAARSQQALNSGNPPGGNGEGETDAQKRARIYGSGGTYFDPQAGRQQGGGVYFTPEINPKQT